MRYFFISVFVFSSVAWAADPSPTLPAEAAKVIATHDKALAAAKAAYDAAVARADATAVKALDPIVVKLTRAGDLKGATAAMALRDELAAKDRPQPVANQANGISLVLVDDGKQVITAKDTPILLITRFDSGFTLAKSTAGLAVVASNAYLQFGLVPAARTALKGHACKIVVRSSIPCTLQYDAESAAYLNCPDKKMSKDGDVVVTEFSIPKATFAGQQAEGGDFRFVIPTGKIFSLRIIK